MVAHIVWIDVVRIRLPVGPTGDSPTHATLLFCLSDCDCDSLGVIHALFFLGFGVTLYYYNIIHNSVSQSLGV